MAHASCATKGEGNTTPHYVNQQLAVTHMVDHCPQSTTESDNMPNLDLPHMPQKGASVEETSYDLVDIEPSGRHADSGQGYTTRRQFKTVQSGFTQRWLLATAISPPHHLSVIHNGYLDGDNSVRPRHGNHRQRLCHTQSSGFIAQQRPGPKPG